VILTGLLGYALSMGLVATTLVVGMAGILPAALVYPALIGSRCIFAVLGSGTGPASHAYVADNTSVADRAAAIAVLGAGMGIGETVGPAIGAALTRFGLAAPIYVASALAAGSAALIWFQLPESGRSEATARPAAPRIGVADPRVLPFVLIGTVLQAVRATTVITLALYMQDTLTLTSESAARHAGAGFVALAVASLFVQLVAVQRLRPAPRGMIRTGLPITLLACVLLVCAWSFAITLVAMVTLGLGLGLVRPGLSAGVSLAVGRDEQGTAAGLLTGVAVTGNVVGPLVATAIYAWAPTAPFLLNAALLTPVVAYALTNRRIGSAVA
jgi:MFS family permease